MYSFMTMFSTYASIRKVFCKFYLCNKKDIQPKDF